MSNSPLVSYTKISPNKTSPRNHAIDTITIHCVVGQLSAESICGCFTSPSRQASCNYAVGYDGKIGLCVEEKDRSWCSSSGSNDHRAITIEVASDTTHPYAVKEAAYKGLIDLLVDICRRNGIKELKWKADKNLIGKPDQQNMTVHRWFANKACPGDYLYNLHGQIAAEVNSRLSGGASGSGGVTTTPKPENTTSAATVPALKPYLVRVTASVLNIRKGPGTNYGTNGAIKDKGVYTIVQEGTGAGATKWGKLKSGVGWISLDYVKKL